jgi:hypothetical protein
MVAINGACGYHVYSTPQHSRRVSDATKTEDEDNRLTEDGISVHSDIEHQGELDDASSETGMNPSSDTTYTNNNINHIESTIHTDNTHSSTVAGHDNSQTSPVFPSPLSSLRSLSKRKNLPPPTLLPPFASSSSSPQPYHYQLNTFHRDNDDDIDRNTLDEIIAYDVTDTIPLQDSIRKVTEYVVVSSRLSQASAHPPGNGNWFINGRVP